MLPAVSVAKDVVAITPSATVAFSPLSKQCALRGFRMEKAGSWPEIAKVNVNVKLLSCV